MKAGLVSGRRPVWFDACVLGFGVFFVFLSTASVAGSQINDAASAFTSAWAVAQHQTLDMNISPAPVVWFVSVDGHAYSDRMPGVIGWAIPFFLILGSPSAPTMFPVATSVAVAASLAVAICFSLFRRLTSIRPSIVAALLMAFATSTWTVSANSLFPHGPNQFWLALLMLGMASRRWWFAGLAGAALIVTRPPLAVCLATAGIYSSLRFRALGPALHIAGVSSLGLIFLLAYNRIVFGSYALWSGSYVNFQSNVAGHGSTYDPTDPSQLLLNVLGFFISPARGILILSPFLLLLLPGLQPAWRAAPTWVQASALSAVSYTLVQLWSNNFGGGSSFYGYRYAIEPLTLAAPLLLLAWTEWVSLTVTRRRIFAALAIASILQHAAGALADISTDASRDGAWSHYLLLDAAYAAGVGQTMLVAVAAIASVSVTFWCSRTRRERTDDEHSRLDLPREEQPSSAQA